MIAAVSCVFTSFASASNLWVINADYENPGTISSLELESPWPIENELAELCPDPVVREFDGLLYAVGRVGCGDIRVFDPSDEMSLRNEFSVGDFNPQDIAVLTNDRAFVSQFNSNWVLEVDPTNGTRIDSVSLAVFADTDGLAELSRMEFVDPYLYVQVQRLDREQFFTPVGDSYLAVIDTNTSTLVDVNPGTPEVDGILLTAPNPIGEMWHDEDANELWVTEVGLFGVTDGGVDRIDLGKWSASGFLTTEAELGGDVLDFTPYDDDRFFTLIANASFLTCLQAVDRTTGLLEETILCASGYDYADIVAAPNGLLYLADRAATSCGVRVFDAELGTELTTSAIDTGVRKPVQLLLAPNEPDPASVDQTILGVSSTLRAFPNPSSGEVRFGLSNGKLGGAFRLEVFDSSGRRVATAQGSVWDGRDDQGGVVLPGMYWAKIVSPSGATNYARLVRTRVH